MRRPYGLAQPSILHLISSLGGGGAERQLSYLASELHRRGVSIHVGCLQEGPNADRLTRAGVPVHQIAAASSYDPRIVPGAIALMRRCRISLVQTWLTQMDVLGGTAAIAARLPFILSERSAPDAYPTSWKNRARRGVGGRAAAVVANSSGGLQYWTARVPSRRRLRRVIPNAIPFEEISEAEPIPNAQVGSFSFEELILVVGRLIEVKNVGALIPALVRVLSCRPGAAAVFLGEGPMAADVSRAAARSGVDLRMMVKGYSNDVFRWFKRASLLVSASAFEGSPNSVLEAAAAGCPLVLSDIPAHRELFDDSEARFVQGDDPPSLAAGILDVLENHDRARAQSKKALAAIQARRIAPIAQAYLELYEEVLML